MATVVLPNSGIARAQAVADDGQETSVADVDLSGAWTLNESCYWYTVSDGVMSNVSIAPCFTAEVRIQQTGSGVDAQVVDAWVCADGGPRRVVPGTTSTGNVVAYTLVLHATVADEKVRGDHVICEWGTNKQPRAATQHIDLSIGQDGNVLSGTWHSSEVDREIPIVLTRRI